MVSCSLDEDSAKQRAEYLFETLKSEEYNLVPHHYTQSFFQNTTKEEYKLFLDFITSKLGKIEDYQLVEITKKYELLSPNYIILNYIVIHSKFKSSHTLFAVEENGKYLIYYHHIDSDALNYDELPESLKRENS